MNEPKMGAPYVNPEAELPPGGFSNADYVVGYPLPPGGIMPIEGDPQKYMLQPPPVPTLAAALAKAQGEMKAAVYNRVNPHFRSRYADLSSVIDAIREPLSKHGLAHSGAMELEPTIRWVETLYHVSGESKSSCYPLPANATHHILGGAITYARRYLLAGLVGIAAEEDDDANAATAAQEKVTPEQVEHLEILIVETGTDIQKYLAYMAKLAKQEIAKLDDIPAAMFPTAFAALDKKHKKEVAKS